MSTYLKPEADRLFVEGLTPTSSDQAWGQTRLGLLPIKIQNLGDAHATIAAGTTVARLTATLTQPRAYTLPSPASYRNGESLSFSDVSGQLSYANYATLYAGNATINGSNYLLISNPYASLILISNGSNVWATAFKQDDYGYVLLKVGNDIKKFESAGDDNVSRMDALRKALQYSQLMNSGGLPAIVELSQGGFRIPAGVPLSTYTSNTVIEFSEGSFVDYENPSDATSDTAFYRGPRNVMNFGAVPRIQFSNDDQHNTDYQYDCLPAFNAAHYSIPVAEANTGASTPTLSSTDLRFGSIFLPAASGAARTVYYLADTWYISAFVTVEGENREVNVTFQDNVATVSEKFVIYLLANWSDGAGHNTDTGANGANTFCASLNNFSVMGNRAYNAFSSGVRMSCNQGGTIPWLRIYECSLRGFITDQNSGTWDVGYLWVQQITRGPAITIDNCTNFTANQIVASFVNPNWAKDADGDCYPAVLIDLSYGTTIHSLQCEDVTTGVKLKNSSNTRIGALQSGPYTQNQGISNATNTDPIVITTEIAHNKKAGDSITIRNVLGNTAANVTNVPILSVINSTQFSLSGIAGNGTYSSSGYDAYFPGVNYGVIAREAADWDISGDVGNSAYWIQALYIRGGVYVELPEQPAVLAGYSGPAGGFSKIGRHVSPAFLNSSFSFFGNGGLDSRLGNITFSAPSGAIKINPGSNNTATNTATFASTAVNLSLATIPTTNPGTGSPGTLWRSGNNLKISTSTIPADTENGYVLLKQGNNVNKFESSANTNVARMSALKTALQYAQLNPSIPAVAELSQGNYGITSGFPLSTYASNVNIKFNEGSAVIYANPEDATADSGFYEGPRNVLNFGALPTFDNFEVGATAVDCLSAMRAAYNSLPRGPGSYSTVTGMGAGETPPIYKGNGTGYTTSAAALSLSATSIPIIAGTGDVLAGDIIVFVNSGNETIGDLNEYFFSDTANNFYTVTSGVSAPGTITIAAPGLTNAIPPNTKIFIKGKGTPLRKGIIYFPQSSAQGSAIYYISDTFYISAHTNLIGENKNIYINFKNGVANVSEKFVVYMLSNESNGPGAANTFDAHIDRLVIRGNVANNPYSSGVRFSCAQRGTIGWLTITQCGLRGFVTAVNGGSIDVGYLSTDSIARGPGISIYDSYSFAATQIVSSFINHNLWAKDSAGDYYPALYAENTKGININAFQAEEVSTGVKLKNSNGVFIPILHVSKYLTTVTNVLSGNPIIITAKSPAGLNGHGRSTGDRVTIFGVDGIPNANVTNVAISAIDATRFALSGVSGSGAYISGGYYLPGNNTGVIIDQTDNYEVGLDVTYASYALVDRLSDGITNRSVLSGRLDSGVIGKYSQVPRLDKALSFVNTGVVESRASNVIIQANTGLNLNSQTSDVVIQAAPNAGGKAIMLQTEPANYTVFNKVVEAYGLPGNGSVNTYQQIYAPAGSNSVIEGVGGSESLCVGTGANKPIYIRPDRTTTVTFAKTAVKLLLATIPTANPGTGSPGTLWRSGNDLKIATDTVVQSVTGLLGNAFPAFDTGADSGTLSGTAFSSVFYSSGGTIRFSGSRPVSAGVVELFALVNSGGYGPGPIIYDTAGELQVRFRNLAGGDIISYNLAARAVPEFDIVIDWSSTDPLNRHKVWLNGVLQTAVGDAGLNPYSTQNQLRWGEANLSVKHLAYYSKQLDTPLVLGSLANLAVAPMADTLSTTLPLSVGGTGSTTASGARVNLGLGLSSSPIFASLTVTLLSCVNITSNGASAASAPAVRLTGAVFNTGGTSMTTTPHLLIEPAGTSAVTTWSTAGTQLGINAASGYTGNFLDFHTNGGSSVFSVTSAGGVNASASIVSNISIRAGINSRLEINGRGGLGASADGVFQLGGNANTANGSLSCGNVYVSNSIKGKLTTDNAFSAVPGLSATGFITMYDSTGGAHKVLCTPYS